MYKDPFVVAEPEFEICDRTRFSFEELETGICRYCESCPLEVSCPLTNLYIEDFDDEDWDERVESTCQSYSK